MSELSILNPYESVDWNTVDKRRFDLHTGHVSKYQRLVDDAEPAKIIDLFHEADFDIMCMSNYGSDPTWWPWTELSERDTGGFDTTVETFQNRDPEQLGMVAVPGAELSFGEHTIASFTTLTHDEMRQGNRVMKVEDVIDQDQYHTEDATAIFAHPGRYYDDSNWRRYRELLRKYSMEDGLLGMEVWAKGGTWRQERTWDQANYNLGPQRFIWAFAANDETNYTHEEEEFGYEVGRRIGTRFNTVLMDSGDFDPSNQSASRQAFREALVDGRFFMHQRDDWIEGDEPRPEYPEIDSIDVDHEELTITVNSSNATTIEWIQEEPHHEWGVVETGPTIEITEEHVPYVRARLEVNGETATQPFGVTHDELTGTFESDAEWDAESDAQWNVNVQS